MIRINIKDMQEQGFAVNVHENEITIYATEPDIEVQEAMRKALKKGELTEYQKEEIIFQAQAFQIWNAITR